MDTRYQQRLAYSNCMARATHLQTMLQAGQITNEQHALLHEALNELIMLCDNKALIIKNDDPLATIDDYLASKLGKDLADKLTSAR